MTNSFSKTVAAVAVGMSLLSAQSIPAVSQDTAGAVAAVQTVASVISANASGGAEALTAALSPLIVANPSLAAEIVAYAKDNPDLSEVLAQVLANIQEGLKSSNPDGAAVVAAIVASAPPAFQAAYAVALSPGDGGGTQTADAGGAADSSGGGAGGGGGGSAGGGFAGSGGGATGGFGGGPVSPN